MASTRISNAAALAACNAIVDRIDLGSGAATGLLKIYTGTAPTNVEDAATGTLLATLTLTNPAFGNAADAAPGATATAATITGDSTADNTGTAGYFRVIDRDATAIIQGDCGTSGAALNLNSTSIVAGVQVDITSWTFTVPET